MTDKSGAVLPNATVTVVNKATGVERSVTSDSAGAYQIASLPPGAYSVTAQSQGMQQYKADLVLEVNRTVEQNITLGVSAVSEVVNVTGEAPVIESSTITVGKVINQATVQQIPLNGRHFVDLALLTPGTVVPPANGFLTAPLRGQGSFGVNTAGTREDQVNFQINGINLNDMANGQITFQPSINTVSEFKMDNSTYSAEEGRNSGAIVNIATRSGSNAFHGEGFEFLRNDYFDARNFFNKSGTCTLTSRGGCISPFKRNQFGGAIGGPIIKNKTFFFATYEGLRQRQGLTLTPSVFTDAQRSQISATNNPSLTKLLALVPAGNDPSGACASATATSCKFLGSATAPVDIDQGTGDVQHNIGNNDRIHGYYVFQRDLRKEPMNASSAGNNVPGSGDTRQSHRQIFTLNESHTFSNNVVNEARFGFNRIHITFVSDNSDDPTAFGLNTGTSGDIGIPRIIINSLGLNFGGFRNFPQGRGDTTAVFSDSVNWLKGNHALKFGSEVRRFFGNSFTGDEGQITFTDVPGFIAAHPTAFVITQGNRPSRRTMSAWGMFAQDSWKVRSSLTLELGLRYEWNFTPGEALNRMVNFIPSTDSLVQVGSNGVDLLYNQNNNNFEPRVGFAWDVFHSGRTVLRGGYGYQVDQMLPNIPNANPPLAFTVQFTSSTAKPFTTFNNLVTDAAGTGITLAGTFDQNYRNAYVQSWNLNLQQQITPTLGMMIGYFGNKGTHLNTQENINQILDQTATRTVTCGAQGPGTTAFSAAQPLRPFVQLSSSSPVLPGACIGNITMNVSNGNSNYNSMWLTVTKRMAHGFQVDGSYTWSKAFDYNSQNFQGVVLQDSFNPRGDYGLSDYDARHHGVISGIYELPFKGNRLASGWRLSGAMQLQSGNPLTPLANNPAACSPTTTPVSCPTSVAAGVALSSFTGVGTSIRPDLLTTPQIVNQIVMSGAQAGNIQWFTNTVCDPRGGACPAGSVFALPVTLVGGRNIFHFGNLQRNSITGPDFKNLDFSLAKTTAITERVRTELRAELFNVFNHPNFSNPNLTVGGSQFGFINATRSPTGDAGSSRQLQLSLKLLF